MKYRRKIFSSFMTLLLLVVTFTSTTYAWFKINSNAEISGFDFKVEGANGIFVSTDNVHFSSDLSSDSLTDAIILSKNKDKFKYNSDGKLVYANVDSVVSDSDKKNELENILLLPVTSTNGYELTDMYGTKVNASSGRFVEFDLYFKAASETESDGSYDVSLFLASESKTDVTMGNKVIRPTTMSSDVDSIKLVADMNTINGELSKNDSINNVYTLNALRFSTSSKYLTTVVNEESMLEEEKEVEKNQIYEFYNGCDYGSYPVLNGSGIYDPTTNASFTYYNNQKASKINPLSKAPETYRYELGTNRNDSPIITNVKCNGTSNLVTFRFWLEGWDADCFDGLSKSIKVSLTFTSSQKDKENVNQ